MDKSHNEKLDKMYVEALERVVREGRVSVSFIQRQCLVGYNRGVKILQWMEEQGYVGAFDGQKTRTVFATMDDVDTLKKKLENGEGIGRKEEVLGKCAYEIISAYEARKQAEENPSSIEVVYLLALQLVVDGGEVSPSILESALGVTYEKAVAIIEWMENCEYIALLESEERTRRILLTKERFQELYGDFV